MPRFVARLKHDSVGRMPTSLLLRNLPFLPQEEPLRSSGSGVSGNLNKAKWNRITIWTLQRESGLELIVLKRAELWSRADGKRDSVINVDAVSIFLESNKCTAHKASVYTIRLARRELKPVQRNRRQTSASQTRTHT